MADAEDNKPTEEQIQEANKQEEAKWQGDFDEDSLKIPYKNEEEATEDGKSSKQDDADKEADSADAEKTEEVEEYSEPEPVVTTEDPGDYMPADHSFEVTLADGKTHKISTVEEAESLADDADNFETPKQLMDFIRKSSKMERLLEKDFEKWESQKQEFTKQQNTAQERQENINTIANGMGYLVDKGLLPAVAKEYQDADWYDSEVAKQPGVKEHLALLNYMVKENAVRRKAGIPEIASAIDAYNAMQADPVAKKAQEAKIKQEAERAAAGNARKAAGARVAGVSPSNQGAYVPKGIAVGNPNVLKRGAAVWDD